MMPSAMTAVIGVAHPKWDERPILLVKLKDGETATKEEFLEFLQGKIAKWWMPDDVVFVDEIPLGATGGPPTRRSPAARRFLKSPASISEAPATSTGTTATSRWSAASRAGTGAGQKTTPATAS